MSFVGFKKRSFVTFGWFLERRKRWLSSHLHTSIIILPFYALIFLSILGCPFIFKNEKRNIHLIHVDGSHGWCLPFLALLHPETPDHLSGQVCRAWHTVGFPSGCIVSCGSLGSNHFSRKLESILWPMPKQEGPILGHQLPLWELEALLGRLAWFLWRVFPVFHHSTWR